MSRYRIVSTAGGSFFDVFSTATPTLQTATLVRVTNTDGTITEINGTGFTFSGVAATGGTITSIVRKSAVGGVIRDQLEQLSPSTTSFTSFWNSPSNNDRRIFMLSNADFINGSAGADSLRGENGDDEFFGSAGADNINGGNGFDLYFLRNETGTGGVFANLTNTSVTVGAQTQAANSVRDSFGNTDTLVSIEGVEGNRFADTLVGNDSDNWFRGNEGADIIQGGGGFDEMTFQVISSSTPGVAPTVVPTTGIVVNFTGNGGGTVTNDGFGSSDTFTSIERIRGTLLNDLVNGDASANSFRGLKGNDTFNGGANIDQVDYLRDAAVNYGTSGAAGVNVNLATGIAIDGFGTIDTLTSVENVRGTDTNDSIVGNNWDNSLQGMQGNDTLRGGDGFDFFQPGLGVDLVDGTATAGNESITNDSDTLAYNDLSGTVFVAGVPVTMTGVIINLSASSFTSGAVTLAARTARDPGGNIDSVIDIERVRGTSQADVFRGSDTENLREELFSGLGGNDTINGGAGFDITNYQNDGGSGGAIVNLSTASITSGAFTVAAGQARDGTGGTDTLISIESVRGTANADFIVGSATRNVIRSWGGQDTINGGGGVDVLSVYLNEETYGFTGPGATVNMLTGTAIMQTGHTATFSNIEDIDGSYQNDSILGDAQDNALNGSLGADTIDGGEGDDIVIGSIGDDSLIGGGGTDSVTGLDFVDFISYFSTKGSGDDLLLRASEIAPAPFTAWTGVNVNLLLGTAVDQGGDSDVISGFEGVIGTRLDDTLIGDLGDNIFYGLGGDDIIEGDAGTDTANYGRFDTFGRTAIIIGDINGLIPNGINVNLTTGVALDGAGGTDSLDSIENIIGSVGDDAISGDASVNVISGGDGSDTIEGRGDDDILDGGVGRDMLALTNETRVLTITMGVDFDDTTISATPGGDFVNDTTSNFEGIRGGLAGDTFIGSTAADWMDGGGGNDTINGNDGDDTLTGGLGNDSMTGGIGNDTYGVGGSGDRVFEAVGGGTDTVVSAITYQLLSSAEIETFNAAAGTAALTLIGNGFSQSMTGNDGDNFLQGLLGNDTLVGGAGNDRLSGGRGNDQLTGGTGLDSYIFDQLPSGTSNKDTITDFNVADDRFLLDDAAFVGIGLTGALGAARFINGLNATLATHRIVYDQTTGKIYFDADGSGLGAKVLFAEVAPATALTSVDFVIF